MCIRFALCPYALLTDKKPLSNLLSSVDTVIRPNVLCACVYYILSLVRCVARPHNKALAASGKVRCLAMNYLTPPLRLACHK